MGIGEHDDKIVVRRMPMAKLGPLGISVGAGILLMHGEGREVFELWFGHIDERLW
jgi:hypothetical protein